MYAVCFLLNALCVNCDEHPRPDCECWQVWEVHGLVPVPAAAGRLPRHPRHRVERRQLGPREGELGGDGDIMANVRFILFKKSETL